MQVIYEDPHQTTEVASSKTMNSTLDQLLGEMAAATKNVRNQKDAKQAGAKAWIRETLKQVSSSSSLGVDPLKFWTNMLNTVGEFYHLL